MSEFSLAIPLVLKHEGHFVDDKVDPGGATNYGISIRYLKSLVNEQPELFNEIDLHHNSIIDTYDIEHMSIDEAEKLYNTEWWIKYEYGNINYQLLANKIFDIGVNIGPSKAAKLIQEACCQLAGYECLVIDGVLGKTSFNYINKLKVEQQDALLKIFCDLVADYYQNLVRNNSSYKKFLQGWLNRAYDCGEGDINEHVSF